MSDSSSFGTDAPACRKTVDTRSTTRSPKRTMSWRFSTLKDLNLNPEFRIVSLNLFQGSPSLLNIGLYYNMCIESTQLHVITSCFTVWKKNKRTNGYAKVIPALRAHSEHSPEDEQRVCVFFFDDNIEWAGTEDSSGICNLRDVESGEFVEFAVGKNGFQAEKVGRHTVLHHSQEYRNVLVKANILDALENKAYFVDIIKRYAEPDEKILVFMDVNSTIVCHDTSEGKDVSGSLMSSMFELIEACPRAPVDFIMDGTAVKLEKTISLKSLVKKLTNDDKASYVDFFKLETCQRLLEELAPVAETRWTSPAGAVNSQSFAQDYTTYLRALETEMGNGGIVKSWFSVFDHLKQENRHTVVLNSYGVDTRKVVLETVRDEREVMQITINYELWTKGDIETFEEQYRQATPHVQRVDEMEVNHPPI